MATPPAALKPILHVAVLAVVTPFQNAAMEIQAGAVANEVGFAYAPSSVVGCLLELYFDGRRQTATARRTLPSRDEYLLRPPRDQVGEGLASRLRGFPQNRIAPAKPALEAA